MNRSVRRVGWTRGAYAALVALATALVACAPPTELLVVVDSDLSAPGQIDLVTIDVTGPTGSHSVTPLALGPGGLRLPLSQPLIPSGDPLGTVTVTVTASRAGVAVVTRTVRTHYVPRQVHVLHIALWCACQRVQCSSTMSCGDTGSCASTVVEPSALPLWNGTLPTLAAPPDGGAAVCSGSPNALVGIAAGTNQTCALRAGGTAVCWGSNNNGVLGDGTTTSRLAPGNVVNLSNAAQIATADQSSCALLHTGEVVCWGQNADGELGDGTTTSHLEPAALVMGLNDAVEIGVGNAFACARRVTGAVVCWGANGAGQLGNGGTVSSGTPVAVAGVSDARQLSVGWNSTCVIRRDGTAWCWGDDSFQQLGRGGMPEASCTVDGGTSGCDLMPAAVQNLGAITQIAVGRYGACALRPEGSVTCWGSNGAGQLGDQTTTSQNAPRTAVQGIDDAIAIAANGTHACALHANGLVACWGNDSSGQTGRSTDAGGYPITAAAGVADATAVTLGENHTCALLGEGGVSCWGSNNQVYGDASDGNVVVPTVQPGLP